MPLGCKAAAVHIAVHSKLHNFDELTAVSCTLCIPQVENHQLMPAASVLWEHGQLVVTLSPASPVILATPAPWVPHQLRSATQAMPALQAR